MARKVSDEVLRAREHHGWAFRGYPEDIEQAIRLYIKTGERNEIYVAKFGEKG